MSAHKEQICPDCKGKKSVVVDGVKYDCSTCNGTGKIEVSETSTTNESARVRLND